MRNASALMFVPTVLFGMSFPVLTHLVTKGSQDIGSSLGIVYGMNTLGGIVGSIVAGYLLLPNLGSQQTLVCLSMLNFLSGMLLFATSSLFTGFIRKGAAISLSCLLFLFLLNSCVGSSSSGVFGTGVSVALDPRTLGTQIDDSIMQKNLQARLALTEKNYLINLSVKVLDGRIFLGGTVDEPEEKLKITKLAWEPKGARSVKNNIAIKQKFSFINIAKDVLITSQLRTALILNKNVKAANFNIDTINQKTYVFGIAHSENEKKEIIQEAKQIVDLKEIVTSILMVSDLSRQRE